MIEIRQMIVKTSVVHRPAAETALARDERRLTEADARQLLEQCRRLVAEMLQERRER